jgi:hypothetical protein
MTPLHVKNAGGSPTVVTYSVNPASATPWLKIAPVKILPGESASVPLTLVVPSDAASGEDHVILTVGKIHYDVRFSVGAPAPAECVAAGYKPAPGTSPSVFLWLLILVVVVIAAFLVRGRLARKR